MPSVIQRRNPKLGRPRQPIPQRPPLAHTIPEWSERTGESEQTVRRKIKAGKLRAIQDGPGGRWRIPTSEYVERGYVKNLSELMT
jgi:excisionase family DNA binding protein